MKYLIIFILIILVAGAVAYYYLVYKPEKEEEEEAATITTGTSGTGTTTTTTPTPVISLDYQIGSEVAAKNDGMLFYDLYGQPTTITKNKYQPVGVVVAMDNIWTKVDVLFGRGGSELPRPFTQRNYLVKKDDVIKIQQ